MTQQNEVYKCDKCGNIAGIIHAAAGNLICCGQEMSQQVENSVDAAKEKHVPVVEKNGANIAVKVGSVSHPMEENHYIEVIGVLTDSKLYREYLKPGGKPEASFVIDGDVKSVRAYCNVHGMWKND